MPIWALLLIVFVAGFFGGLVNAWMSGNGLVLPTRTDGVVQPGFLGNAVTGGVAAAISWGLYGPLAAESITATTGGTGIKGELTLAALAGAVLVGIAGARWLTNEVDKSLLRAAAVTAATSATYQVHDDVVTALAAAAPAEALKVVKEDSVRLAALRAQQQPRN